MKRRGLTVLLGCVLLALLVWQTGRIRVPYVELGPGPTVDTLGVSDHKPVISVQGAQASKSAGQLRLVTVSVQPELTLFAALRGWWSDDGAVVPKELIYPPNQTQQQVDKQNAQDFKESQSSAETAALRELGYPVEVTVTKLADGFPAAGVLAADDVILTVDGTAVTSAQKLSSLVRAKGAGTPHEVVYRRGGETRTATVQTAKGEDGAARLGVTVEQRQPHPFTLTIQLDKIGGPSAGLMFALGVIDTVKPEDLTGGMVIAGTGTIDDDGNVGRIGGIQQKVPAAKAAGAKAFLVPAGNCGEAVANAEPGMKLVKVENLRQALDALQALREHRTPTLCTP